MAYRGYTYAQSKATQRYTAKAYDRFVVTVRKDETPGADDIRAAAAAAGMSTNNYIKVAIQEKMERDAGNVGPTEDKPIEAAEMPAETKSNHKPMKL